MSGPAERPPLKLLIDACLTPAALTRLQEVFGAAVDAVHVDAVLPPTTPDEAVFDHAAAEGRAVMTANHADFLALARKREGHPGVLFVDDQNTRERQMDAVELITRAVLVHLDAGRPVAGHVFTWRRAARRLAVRAVP